MIKDKYSRSSLKIKLFLAVALPFLIVLLLINAITIINKINYEQDLIQTKVDSFVSLLETGELSFSTVKDKMVLESNFNESINYAILLNKNSDIIYSTEGDSTPVDFLTVYDPELTNSLAGFEILNFKGKRLSYSSFEALVFTPIVRHNEVIGVFVVSIAYVEAARRVNEFISFVVLLSILGTILAVLISNFIANRLILRKIAKLADFAIHFDTNKMNSDIDKNLLNSQDEIGGLSESFHHMVGELKKSQKMLKQYNKTLESKVRQRTRQLSRKVKELDIAHSKLSNRSLELKANNLALKNANKEIEKFNLELDKRVQERTEELRVAYLKIKHLLDMKSEFVNQIAHDLRTPLTPVTILMPMIRKAIKQNKLRKAVRDLNIVDRNFKFLSLIVTETLDIARIESGKMKLNINPCKSSDLLSDLEYRLRPMLQKENFTLQIDVNSLDVHILADCLRLQEIFVNLVSNSIKYHSASKKRIIKISAKRKGKFIEFAVSDNGIGVSKKHIGKLFDEFYRVDDARHDAAASSGLGLAIVRKLVHMHGGTVRAESKGLGRGLTVRFTVPISKDGKCV